MDRSPRAGSRAGPVSSIQSSPVPTKQGPTKLVSIIVVLAILVTALAFGYTGADPTHDFKTPYKIIALIGALGLQRSNTTEIYAYPVQMQSFLDNLTTREVGLQPQSLSQQCYRSQQSSWGQLGCSLGEAFGYALLKGFGVKFEVHVYQWQWFQWIKIHDFVYPPS